MHDFYHTRVSDAGFSRRTTNALMDHGFEYLGDVFRVTTKELMKLRGLGQVCISEIKEFAKAKEDEINSAGITMQRELQKLYQLQLAVAKDIDLLQHKLQEFRFTRVNWDD